MFILDDSVITPTSPPGRQLIDIKIYEIASVAYRHASKPFFTHTQKDNNCDDVNCMPNLTFSPHNLLTLNLIK